MNQKKVNSGVKFLYYTSILELCLVGLALVMAVLAVIFGEIEIVTGIASILLLLLAIGVLVLKLIGVIKLYEVNTNFNYAFFVFIGVIVLQIIDMILNNAAYNKIVNGIFTIIVGLGQLACIYYVIKGFADMFKSLNNSEMENCANKNLYIILAAACGVFLVDSVNSFLNYGTLMDVLSAVSSGFAVVGAVFAFLFIKKCLAQVSNSVESSEEPKDE